MKSITFPLITILGLITTLLNAPSYSEVSQNSIENPQDRQTSHVLAQHPQSDRDGIDSEFVVRPETPVDPDAVVVPPVVDAEMALDPVTQKPMTKKQAEALKIPHQPKLKSEGKDNFGKAKKRNPID